MPRGVYKRTQEHINNMKKSLKGLKKPSLLGNQNAKGNKPNKSTFQKGHIPWNKGIKFKQICGSNNGQTLCINCHKLTFKTKI